MDPCRPVSGRQGPVARPPGDRTPVVQWPGDRVFFAKFTRPETSKCSAEALEGACRPATGRQVPLSPGGRATGPLPPIKCVCLPRKVIWSQKFPEKRERGRKSEAAKPCWILGLRSLGNCLAHVLDQYVLYYYIIVLRSIFTIFD